MHRSRLYGVFVDAPLAEAERSVDFWSAALGIAPVRSDTSSPFVGFPGAVRELVFEVQAVDDAPRFHVDIETDDVAAETERLKALGAVEHVRHDGWVVLRAPGGHLLCVVPIQSSREVFEATGHDWDS